MMRSTYLWWSLSDTCVPNLQEMKSQLCGCKQLSGPSFSTSLPDGLIALYRHQVGPICMQVIRAPILTSS